MRKTTIVLAAMAAIAALSSCSNNKENASAPASDVEPICQKYQRFLTDPEGYVVYRATGEIKVDGVLDEKTWENAPEITNFRDISGDGFPDPLYKTTAKILWDDNYLYIGAELDEPNVWAYLQKHDEVIYNDPDFEVFIDPDNDGQNYFEIETNAIGTVFDLFIQKPYRCKTRAFVTFSWDAPGMKLATKINGTLNKPEDTDKGWAVEIAIPKEAIAAEFDNYLVAGNYLRLGFSRVEWQTEVIDGKVTRKCDAEGKRLPEFNWTWPATGMIAMHMPERWNYLYLSDKPAKSEIFEYPADHKIEKLLWGMYYAQDDALNENGKYNCCVEQFNLTDAEKALLPEGTTLKVEATTGKFEITATKADGSSIRIDENGYILRNNK